jgi:hypothetical protein
MLFFVYMLSCTSEEREKQENSKVVSLQQEIEKQKEKSRDKKKSVIDLSSQQIEQDILAPSPLETQKTLRDLGVSIALHEFVQSESYKFTGNSREQAAIRVGVLLCDLIISIDKASKAEVLKRFSNIIEGMAIMKVGQGLMDMVKEMHTEYANDAMTKQEIVESLDNIAAMSVPGDGFSKDDPTGPLLQAGAWLEGVNLVTKALIKENKIEIANKLLRLEHVATYFLQYAEGEGKEKTTKQILEQMKISLIHLKKISTKKEISRTDLDTAVAETERMLSFL